MRPATGDAVFELLGALLAAQRPRLEMSRARVVVPVAVGAVSCEASATLAIAALLDPDGGRRFKRCRVEDCADVFLDWTKAVSRTGCRLHPRRSVPVADRR
jgi:predicted RNA-binding Zn ribbon-like protein